MTLRSARRPPAGSDTERSAGMWGFGHRVPLEARGILSDLWSSSPGVRPAHGGFHVGASRRAFSTPHSPKHFHINCGSAMGLFEDQRSGAG